MPRRIFLGIENEKCRILHEADSSVADYQGLNVSNLDMVSLKMRAPLAENKIVARNRPWIYSDFFLQDG